MPLNAAYLKEIKQEYDRIRFRNRQELNARIDEVHAKVPQIAEIDATIRDLAIDAALAALREEDEDKKAADKLAVEKQTGELIEQKYRLLVQAGYPKNYLAPVYTCEKCRDTGYINQDYCECMKHKIVERQYRHSNLNRDLAHENFEHFCFDYYANESDGTHKLTPRENIENVYQSLQQYIQHVSEYFDGNDRIKASILFNGTTGVGKTFLTKCVAKELLDAGYAVLYTSASNLFQMAADVQLNKNQIEGSQEFLFGMEQCDFLIIDDLGTELSNNFTASCFYSLINNRLLQHRATIISTNLSLKEIRELYSERIFSRICENYLIYTIYGDDIRFAKRKQWQSSASVSRPD